MEYAPYALWSYVETAIIVLNYLFLCLTVQILWNINWLKCEQLLYTHDMYYTIYTYK